MKIAFDGKRFFHNASGLGNYSRDLVRILSKFFPDHQYLILHKNKSDRGNEILDQPNVSYVKTSAAKLARQLKNGIKAQQAGADIYHGLSGELPLKWNSKPIKKIVTIHDLIFLRYPRYYSWFDRKVHFWKFKKAASAADQIIAISRQTKDDIIKYLKVDQDKITVVYQGCHDAFKQKISTETKFDIKQKYQLPGRFILNVGTIEPRKNLFSVVRAVEETAIPVIVIGKKTSYYKKIKGHILKNKMQDQIHFLEGVNVNELACIYQLADFLVYPSHFEGFGIPIIEALFSGIPVITSNVSSLPEAGGEGALYINPANVQDLRAKILFLWNNPAERERLSLLGRKHIDQFNDENVAQELMSVYKNVL